MKMRRFSRVEKLKKKSIDISKIPGKDEFSLLLPEAKNGIAGDRIRVEKTN